MSIAEALEALEGPGTGRRFRELLKIATHFFGEPRIRGSHHIFKMPWAGDPRINLKRMGTRRNPIRCNRSYER